MLFSAVVLRFQLIFGLRGECSILTKDLPIVEIHQVSSVIHCLELPIPTLHINTLHLIHRHLVKLSQKVLTKLIYDL